MNTHPMIAEWRDNLPDVIEGRDPVEINGDDWYLACLRSYAPDGLVTRPAERETGRAE